MKLTIFSKKRTTKEGKPFTSYISKLQKKDGSEVTASVKFRDDCGNPKPEDCPMNIVVDKKAANLASRTYTDSETGEVRESLTLWVTEWSEGEPYVDHSLDEFI